MKITDSLVVVLGVLLLTSCDASLRATSKLHGSVAADRTSMENGVHSMMLGGRHLSEETPSAAELWAKLLAVDPQFMGRLALPTSTPVQTNVDDSGERQLTTSTPSQSQITSLRLINANTDRAIVTLKDGMVIALDTIKNMTTPAFNINATFNGTGIRSVKYGYNNTNRYRVENTAPFSFCGNNRTDYFSCSRLGFGTHTVTVTPYARSDASGTPGTPITMKFTIIPSDVTPPKILNFTALTPTTVDVSNGEKNITLLITVQDDSSGFDSGLVGYGNSNEDIIEQLAYYRVIYYEVGTIFEPNPIAGAPVTFIVTMTVKKHRPAGVYSLHFNHADSKFNLEYNNGTDLTNKGFVGSITVLNSGQQDTTAPALVSLVALNPLTINVTAGDVTVDFRITVQDDISGFGYGFLSAVNETLTSDYYGYVGFSKPLTRTDDVFFLDHGPELPPGVPHAFTVSLVFDKGLPPGNYGLELEITDGVRNWNFLNSTKLAAMGFPSKVTVVA